MEQNELTLLLSEWTSKLTTRSGASLRVRPASPEDRDKVGKFLQSVDAGDLRFRFLSSVKPSEAIARILTDVDHSQVEDLIAFDANDNSVAATAMIAKSSSPEVAEAAVLVRSDLKNRGIGWAMLREACNYAKAKGFRRIECIESSSNLRAIELEEEQGFVARVHPGNATITILSKDLAYDA